MSDEKKDLGAPASDDTRALFVSARKKQLADQEEQRRREEEEQKRQASEAEVRRLEAEVQARKMAAEEEARRIEEERIRLAQQAANPLPPDAVQQPAGVGRTAANVGQAVGGVLGGVALVAKNVTAQATEAAKAKVAAQPTAPQAMPQPPYVAPPAAQQSYATPQAPLPPVQPTASPAQQPYATQPTAQQPYAAQPPTTPVTPQPMASPSISAIPSAAQQSYTPAEPTAPSPIQPTYAPPTQSAAQPVTPSSVQPAAPQPIPAAATSQIAPDAATAVKKPNVKLLVVVAVVIVAVVIFLLTRGGGLGGGSTAKLFEVSLSDYAAMSAVDQTAFVNDARAFFAKEGMPEDFEEAASESEEVKTEIIGTLITNAALEAEYYSNPLMDASGTPIFFVGMYYEGGNESINGYVKKYLKYNQPSEGDLESINLADYCRLQGDELIGVLLAAKDYLAAREIPTNEGLSVYTASYAMYDTCKLLVEQGAPDATAPFGLLAAFGYMVSNGGDEIAAVTGISPGVFVKVPSIDDELDEQDLLTGFGYAVSYSSETFSVVDTDRDFLYFSALTETESGNILIAMVDEGPAADGNIEGQLYGIAMHWFARIFGEQELKDPGYSYTVAEDGVPRYLIEGYVMEDDGSTVVMNAYVSFVGNKPCVVISVSALPRADTYKTISLQMFQSIIAY